MDEILEAVTEEVADAAASSADELVIGGLELGPPVLGDTVELVGDTVDAVADASPSSAGAITGEAVATAGKVLGAAEEVHNAVKQINQIHDTCQENLDATLNATDPLRQGLDERIGASSAAFAKQEITQEEHNTNLDQIAQENLQLDAATNEQLQGIADSGIAGEAAAAVSGVARGVLKSVGPFAEVIGVPMAGEALLEGVGLPKTIN